MQSKNITKLNKIAIVSLVLFSIITIARSVGRVPWFDEAHLWTLAENLNFVDMLINVKNEGHFFIWPTLVYPFAKLHLYPYSMIILNWIFCILALILMWAKAPFHNAIKVFMTFSFPFLGCYGVLARCYSIGILFLFALATLFQDKLKYPKMYALLLILAANTSVMALIGATAFGLIFLKDFIQNWKSFDLKNKIVTSSILVLGAILIMLQAFTNTEFETLHVLVTWRTSVQFLLNTYIQHHFLINSFMTLIFAIFIFKYLFTIRVATFFMLFTEILILVLAFRFYGLQFWHAYFIYIYLIISIWIANNISEPSREKRNANIILGLISFIIIFNTSVDIKTSPYYKSEAKHILQIIEQDENLNHSKIIHNTGVLYEALPYAHGKTYTLRNYCSIEENMDHSLFRARFSDCVKGNIFGQAQKSPDIIKSITDDNTYAYMDKNKIDIQNFAYIMADGYAIFLKKYKCYGDHCFWKVEIR